MTVDSIGAEFSKELALSPADGESDVEFEPLDAESEESAFVVPEAESPDPVVSVEFELVSEALLLSELVELSDDEEFEVSVEVEFEEDVSELLDSGAAGSSAT